MRALRRPFAPLVALALLCGPAARAGAAPSDPWTLYRGLMDSREIVVHVSPEVETAPIEAAVERLVRRSHLKLRIAGPDRGKEPVAAGTARVVVGGFETPGVAPLLARLEVEELETGFRFDRRSYRGPRDALIATFEDPERPGLPVTLVFSADPAQLGGYLTGFEPAWRPGYACYRRGELERVGRLRPGGDVVTDESRGFDHKWQERFENDRARQVGDLLVSVPRATPAQRIDLYVERLGRARREVAAWTDTADTLPPALVALHGHPEDMAALLLDLDLSIVNAVTGDVHVLLAPGLPDDGGAGIARATAVAALGRPVAPWLLDGVGAATAGTWWGRPLERWLARLRLGGLIPPAAELLDVRAPEQLSQHVLIPARAWLFRLLREREGDEGLCELWTGMRPLMLDAELIGRFDSTLDALREEHRLDLENRARTLRAQAVAAPFRRGIAFTRHGDALLQGYGSRGAIDSLQRAAELGASSITVSVDAFLDPGLPGFPVRASHGGRWASDPDVALAQSIAAARALGMDAMLQPQLLTRPSGSLAGQRVITEWEGWEEFFDHFERTVVHYGLLAELTRCQILCIASDIPTAIFTDQRRIGDEAEQSIGDRKAQRWEQLIARARDAFSGALTYSSQWENKIPAFVPQLDFLGLSLFSQLWQPVPPGVEPSERQAVAGLTRNLAMVNQIADELQKPLLITAVGFPASDDSWFTAWKAQGDVDLEAQSILYGSLAKALDRHHARPRFRGFFLWDWSTDPSYGGHDHRGFTPQNKPAESVLEDVFRSR